MYALIRQEHQEVECVEITMKEFICVSEYQHRVEALREQGNALVKAFRERRDALISEYRVLIAARGAWSDEYYERERAIMALYEEFGDKFAEFENRPRGESDFQMWFDGYGIEYVVEQIPSI